MFRCTMNSENSYTYMYVEAVRILTKGYLPISLVTPLKLKGILDAVKTTI